MSDLEEIIKNRRAAFDVSEPSEGHEERFALKLQKRSAEKKSRELFWRVAAAAIIFALVGVSVWMPREKTEVDIQLGSLTLAEISEDLGHIEQYYRLKIDTEAAKIKTIAKIDSEAAAYLNELARLEAEYRTLERELYASGGHDKVITSMIVNFRLRLELIENINNKLVKLEQNL